MGYTLSQDNYGGILECVGRKRCSARKPFSCWGKYSAGEASWTIFHTFISGKLNDAKSSPSSRLFRRAAKAANNPLDTPANSLLFKVTRASGQKASSGGAEGLAGRGKGECQRAGGEKWRGRKGEGRGWKAGNSKNKN